MRWPLIIVLIALLLLVAVIAAQKEDELSIETHQCQQEACARIIASLLKDHSACAFYELTQPVLIAAINATQSRVVMDREEFKPYTPLVRRAKNSALMHNKFCVVGDTLITGSYNPSNNTGDDNNMLVIRSRHLADAYRLEFEELWAGERGERRPGAHVADANASVSAYFCPEDGCAQRVVEEVRGAKSSVLFMAFSFTHDAIATELIRRDDLAIRGVMERSQKSKYAVFERLSAAGIDVRWDGNKRLMHHKVFIIDNRTVITGSFNPTKNADQRNDENMVIIKDKETARVFLSEFDRVWALAGNESK